MRTKQKDILARLSRTLRLFQNNYALYMVFFVNLPCAYWVQAGLIASNLKAMGHLGLMADSGDGAREERPGY